MKHIQKLNLILVVGWVVLALKADEIQLMNRMATLESKSTEISLEQYWSETGLDDEQLKLILADQSCYESKAKFLVCARTISAAAEKRRLVLNHNFQLASGNFSDLRPRPDEKSDLDFLMNVLPDSRFEEFQQNKTISFLKIWEQLKAPLSRKELPSLVAAATNAFLAVALDPHTYILPTKYYENVVAQQATSQFPFGFTWKRIRYGARVRKVFPFSPAERAGLRSGDEITSINGRRIEDLWQAEATELLSGKKNKEVLLTYQRGNGSWIAQVKASEQVYNSVDLQTLRDNRRVPVLTIHRFALGTCELAKQYLEEAIAQPTRAVFLDLRDNSGGQVSEAACVINLFVEKGKKLFEMRFVNSKRPTEKYESAEQPIYNGPLIVLMNSASASAAEIVAGSLQDLGRATLVGERTFGKGTFQDGKSWASNSSVLLFQTGGMYFFPSGKTSQLDGVQPDFPVQTPQWSPHESDLFWKPLRPARLQTLSSNSNFANLSRIQSCLHFDEQGKGLLAGLMGPSLESSDLPWTQHGIEKEIPQSDQSDLAMMAASRALGCFESFSSDDSSK